MANSSPSVAATSTLAMIRTAEARGVSTADLLDRAGFTYDLIADPDARIPATNALALWNALRERTGDPALQLAAPASLPFGAYRVIDYLVAASESVGFGVLRFARFFRIIADAIALHIDDADHEHCLRIDMTGGAAAPPVYVDYVFAALVSRIRMRVRPDLHVLRVEFRQNEPHDPGPYLSLFRAPVRFAAPADRLCFSDTEWNAPMLGADSALARLLEDHATDLFRRLADAGPGFTHDVRRSIAAAPPESASASDIARALHVSVRTLQRRLGNGGTTFRQLADSVRASLAQQYLADPRVSIAEVAFLLGFSDQSSFNRAFRRWTGLAPGRWRRQHRRDTLRP